MILDLLNYPECKVRALLNAIEDIIDICEDTPDLNRPYVDNAVENCDQALTDILRLCEKVLSFVQKD